MAGVSVEGIKRMKSESLPDYLSGVSKEICTSKIILVIGKIKFLVFLRTEVLEPCRPSAGTNFSPRSCPNSLPCGLLHL